MGIGVFSLEVVDLNLYWGVSEILKVEGECGMDCVVGIVYFSVLNVGDWFVFCEVFFVINDNCFVYYCIDVDILCVEIVGNFDLWLEVWCNWCDDFVYVIVVCMLLFWE